MATLSNLLAPSNVVLTGGSYSNPSWITSLSEVKVLPTQTNNGGKVLTTNGTSTSWSSPDGPALIYYFFS